MKQKLIDFIKYNPFVFFLYNRIGSILVRLWGLFIPMKEKKILFVSFGGKKYDDSPQIVYEKMLEMEEFSSYEFVWAFIDTNRTLPGNPRIIKIDSFRYLYHALSSKFWIINVSAERGLNFKKKKTICINTWHGTPLKKIYGEENANKDLKRKRKPEVFSLVCSQSKYDQEIFARIFNMNINDVLISDLPRNDRLLKYSKEDIKAIKNKLGIPENKKVILYMPTYREYIRNSSNACMFNPPMDLNKWENLLGEDYVLLFRAHYLVVKSMNIEPSNFVKDVSNYEQLSDLYAVSDIMISDYSSAFFDFSILERPELCFAYDIEEYQKKRGLYMNISELPCDIDYDEDTLIKHILYLDYEQSCRRTKKFKEKYAPVAGNAAEYLVEEIRKRYLQGK